MTSRRRRRSLLLASLARRVAFDEKPGGTSAPRGKITSAAAAATVANGRTVGEKWLVPPSSKSAVGFSISDVQFVGSHARVDSRANEPSIFDAALAGDEM